MKWPNLVGCVVLCANFSFPTYATENPSPAGGPGPFEPTWESLKRHQDPQWFRDAKFGIYTHWGPVTVGCEDCPQGGQWYGHEMYIAKNPVFTYHKKRFGDQAKVGYKDIIPQFTAKKFDAEAWADLFARSGAKFAGPVAVHHDNFAMWDSEVTPWNSVKIGPHRDITGELEKAIRKRGLKFITTFHHGFAWRYYQPAFAFDAADPRYTKLYTESHKPGDPPSKAFQEQWLAMVNEAVRKYQPDMIWFDFELMAVITPEYQRRMFADYYNWAAEHHRDSAVAHKFREIQQHTGILDFERGREDRLVPYPWLTDTALAEWFNQRNAPYRSADYMITILADIVAKNGCMLLERQPRGRRHDSRSSPEGSPRNGPVAQDQRGSDLRHPAVDRLRRGADQGQTRRFQRGRRQRVHVQGHPFHHQRKHPLRHRAGLAQGGRTLDQVTCHVGWQDRLRQVSRLQRRDRLVAAGQRPLGHPAGEKAV